MDRALAAVRTGANLRERGTRRLFQIVVVPAFDSAASWEIFELKTRANGTSHDIVVTAWDQRCDSHKFQSPVERLRHPVQLEPSLRSDRIHVRENVVHGLVALLADVQIPVIPDGRLIGADGTLYRLEIGDPFGGAAFDWWEEGPPAWAPLVIAVGKVHAVLEDLAPSRAHRD